jgi:hypothetical protein
LNKGLPPHALRRTRVVVVLVVALVVVLGGFLLSLGCLAGSGWLRSDSLDRSRWFLGQRDSGELERSGIHLGKHSDECQPEHVSVQPQARNKRTELAESAAAAATTATGRSAIAS